MYAENIDQCLEKLKEAARNAREKKVVMIKQVQLVMIEDQRHDGDEVVRQLYLDTVDIECFEFKENLKTLADIYLVNPWDTTGGAFSLLFLIHDDRALSFLIHESRALAGPYRILVFGTDDARWSRYLDGNFTQVYVICAKLDQGAVSCVYAFLPGKDQYFYVELFQALQMKFNHACFKKVNEPEVDRYKDESRIMGMVSHACSSLAGGIFANSSMTHIINTEIPDTFISL